MNALAWSLVTVVAWGIWLAPLEVAGRSDERTRTLFITLGNLVVAVVVASLRGFAGLTWPEFWPAALGGLVWAWSGVAAVAAVQRLGIAMAMGIWSPLNILVSLIWGAVLFRELGGLSGGRLALLAFGVTAMVAGIALVITAREARVAPSSPCEGEERRRLSGGPATLGLLAAALAGVGWGSYFIPIRLAETSSWVAAFPLAVGMVVGAAAPVALAGRRPQRSGARPVLLALLAGALWAAGNYGSLQLMERIGTGRGFTVAQACLVINALVGIFVFRRPAPRTRAAWLTLAGIAAVTLGAVAVGAGK